MAQKISGYAADGTSNPLKNEDLLDVSNEDGGGGFDVSKKITVAELLTFINSGVLNIYNADGTILADRTLTAQTFFTRWLGGDVEVKMSDEINDYAFIVRDSSDNKMAIVGYDQATTSGEIQLIDGTGLFLEAKNGNLNLLGSTNLNLITGNITFNDGNVGTFSHEALTGPQSWDLPDDSGVIALVKDQDVGNSLFVSSKGRTIANGAVRESLSRHFSSMTEALSAAVAGDTIYVYGNQTPNANIYKKDVEWVFEGNPIITNNQALFNDGGVTGNCVVRGNASFNCVGGVFAFSGVGTIIDIECRYAITTTGVCAQLEDTIGTLTVGDTMTSSTGAVIYIDKGTDVIINAKSVIGTKTNGLTTNVRATFTGQFILNADYVSATPTIANSMVCYWAQVGSTGKTIFNISDKIELLGAGVNCQAMLPGNGTVIINGDIDGGVGNAWGIEQTPENVTHNGNAINDGSHPLVSITGADACKVWLNGTFESSNADVIVQDNVNSTLNINGRIVNTNALAVAKHGVLVLNNTSTIFGNVVIVLDLALGTPACIGALVAKNVKVFHHVGTNSAEDGNITNVITGTNITTDTDYE